MTATRRQIIRLLLTAALFLAAPSANAQEHQPSTPTPQSAVPQGAQPAHPPAEEHATEEEHHEEGLLTTAFRLANFAILAGILVYFLRTPIANYLASRSAQIRQDLVTAAAMRSTATAQLAEIENKLKALPGELDALKRQGAQDVEAERARIAAAAAAERTRLLDQTRREIDMRLRIAKRELTEHAAQLAVDVAETRIRRSITPDDQLRLVDRYASQLREAR